MKIRKILLFVVAACLLLSACTQTDDSTTGTTTSKATSSGTTTSSTTAATEPITAEGTQAELYIQMLSDALDYIPPYFEATGETEKIAPYEETLTVTSVNAHNAAIENMMLKLEERYGETYDSNRYTDLFKRTLNINIQYKWWVSAEDFNQKLRLDMTANDLADIFMVRSQNDVIQLAEAGAIQPLTDLYDTWASEDNKEIWASDDGALKTMASIGDENYGMPSGISDTDFFSYLWIRSDWMDNYGLEYPETMDQLRDIMTEFVEADPKGEGQTIGILMDKSIWYSARGVFNSFAAYPEIWIESDDGLVWGGIAESNKDALTYLRDLYQKGLIDQEFVTKTRSEAEESLVSGNCGVTYGGHWVGHRTGVLHDLEPESDWRCITLPVGTVDPVVSPINPSYRGWVVVNSNFDHPEAAFKMRSINTCVFKERDSAWWTYEENQSNVISPVNANVSAFDNLFTYLNLLEAFENNDESVLRAKAVPYWANLHGERAWEWMMMFGPEDKTPMKVLNEAYEKDLLFYNAFLGAQGPIMQDRWTAIRDEQLISFTKIISGEVDVNEGFDAWINTFKNLGGQEVTEEVNEWYNNQ
jgi:putative aldouronate transport system substrate-binding protein